ncbi:gastricsin [Clonorchis sinensis]|uniref:Gastricsin n=1 Tax=Clonorchis sinensis TaxID=79923 RepID=G7Y6P2_CLOSI|nr:gastricsin [Clonorchis sinensis]
MTTVTLTLSTLVVWVDLFLFSKLSAPNSSRNRLLRIERWFMRLLQVSDLESSELSISRFACEGNTGETSSLQVTGLWGNACGPIQIGEQQFKVIFDTGGFSRWLPSSRSAPHVFSSRTKYDKNSPTRISMEKEYRTSYSGCPVEHFIFAEMIYSSIVVDASEGFDGIVGMRKPQGDQKRGDLFRITLIDHLLATGSVAEAIFTFRFCGRPGVRQFSWFENGNLILGGVREDFHHLPIVYVPTYQSKQWTVFIDRFLNVKYHNLMSKASEHSVFNFVECTNQT